jgi:hypothetical protein
MLELALEEKARTRAADFARRWQRGEQWPPIRAHESGHIVDGQHRLLAAVMLNQQTIAVDLI